MQVVELWTRKRAVAITTHCGQRLGVNAGLVEVARRSVKVQSVEWEDATNDPVGAMFRDEAGSVTVTLHQHGGHNVVVATISK